MEILFVKSPAEIIMDKLQDSAEITKQDVTNLNMYNEAYINLLFSFGQQTVRGKMLEVMTRESVVVFE